ncbi:MAG TPA: diheme cytochrome c-553 [Casimicrobiaceae bacterium]|nr:diheme cytochrome c-553 [Casimicrobiaceae bacterium]
MRGRHTAFTIAALATALVVAVPAVAAEKAGASKAQIKRGEYLVNYGGCNDCHTPKIMTPNGPQPDPVRLLSGHPSDAHLPPVPPGVVGPNPNQWAALTNADLTAWAGPWGTSFAANITPDVATGIGGWTADQFIKTMRTGKHLGGGRPILPPMPWFNLAVLNEGDLRAVFAYLKSIKPMKNQVPQPISPKGP